MEITVNGKHVEVLPKTTISLLMDMLGQSVGGVAVAVNDEIVRRAEWPARCLSEGDTITIIGAAYGG